MHLTIKLVDLLYWEPVPTKGSQGEAVYFEMKKEREIAEKARFQSNFVNKKKTGLTADMDLEARKAYGRALMRAWYASLQVLFIFVNWSTEYIHLDLDYDSA